MDEILEKYDTLRLRPTNDQTQKIVSLKSIASTTQKIREIAAQTVHLVITRHQIAPSDMDG